MISNADDVQGLVSSNTLISDFACILEVVQWSYNLLLLLVNLPFSAIIFISILSFELELIISTIQ